MLRRGLTVPVPGVRDFSGKVVVVTGAAGGLGRALCMRFGQAGAGIAALDLDGSALVELSNELRHCGVQAIAVACDVTVEADCLHAMTEAKRRFGAIDVLVNNAGITHRSAFARTETAVLRRVMAVNYFGALHCTHAALDDLLARRGMLITISSVAGFAPLIARTGYAASKHALHGFCDSLRSEVEPLGLKVMLVCPAFIQTGIERNALDARGLPARHPQAIVGVRASPASIADRVFEAARRERRLLLPDRLARVSWWVSRWAPGLYARMMAARLGKEMQQDSD